MRTALSTFESHEFRRRWVPAAALAGLLFAAACHTLRPVQPGDLSASPDLQRVWVTRADHSTVIVEHPALVGDTLMGSVQGAAERIPLSQVALIQARQASPRRTYVAVAIVGGVVAGATVLYLNSQKGSQKSGLCYVTPDMPPVQCCLVDISNGNATSC